MNGAAPEIQVVKPFSEAVELTKKILFRPVDLKKWLVIGFASWLAHLGGGFSFSGDYRGRSDLRDVPAVRGLTDAIHRTPASLLIAGVIFAGLLLLCIIVLIVWLRARGRLMFVDCVFRNRAAIAAPWRVFSVLGYCFVLF